MKIKAANAALIERLETTTTKKRTKGGKEPSAKAESGITRQPPKLRVITWDTRYIKSVRKELLDLLARTDRGEIVGIAYAAIASDRSFNAGLAGLLANDRIKAVGALTCATIRVSDSADE